MLSRELERNLQGILERVPANYIAAIVGAWVASRFVYKLFGCTMMHMCKWLWIPEWVGLCGTSHGSAFKVWHQRY